MTPLGLYLSIPFCKAKCTFCNFASDAYASDRLDGYIDRLCNEIRTARANAGKLQAQLPQTIDTLYFGGGTPSLLTPTHLNKIFTAIRSEFTFEKNPEITLECAPGQLADDTLCELLAQGVNRVSLGVQSFADRESAAVGRLHTAIQCLAEIARLRAVGIYNISLDLIAGLPHQTSATWRESIYQLLATEVPHASVYLLDVDDDSRLGREMLAHGERYGAAAVPTEDEAAQFYQTACDAFSAAGLHQYEISNFARQTSEHCHQSRHNLKYWQRKPYLGFGLDAHSMLAFDEPNSAVRFANTDSLDLYLAKAPAAKLSEFDLYSEPAPSEPEPGYIGLSEAFEESLFLGLRLNVGVDLARLRHQFGDALVDVTTPAIEDARAAGLMDLNADRLKLTDRGRLASNEVFSRLLLTPA
jgi:oxygen-independent coproporphyrinogen III oxidase